MAVAMSPERKSLAFDDLRELLAVHEAAEEVVDLRNAEEKAAAQPLTELEGMPADNAEFNEKFADFAKSVAEHAEAKEVEEFARLLETCDDQERKSARHAPSLSRETGAGPPSPCTRGMADQAAVARSLRLTARSGEAPLRAVIWLGSR